MVKVLHAQLWKFRGKANRCFHSPLVTIIWNVFKFFYICRRQGRFYCSFNNDCQVDFRWLSFFGQYLLIFKGFWCCAQLIASTYNFPATQCLYTYFNGEIDVLVYTFLSVMLYLISKINNLIWSQCGVCNFQHLKYEHKGYSTPKYVHGGYRSEITAEFKMPFTSILALYFSDVMIWLGTGSECYL